LLRDTGNQLPVPPAKIKLSSVTQSLIELEFNYDNKDYEIDIPLSRQKLKDLSESIINKSILICKRLLLSQGLKKEQLHRVVLVGGPANMHECTKQFASVIGFPRLGENVSNADRYKTPMGMRKRDEFLIREAKSSLQDHSSRLLAELWYYPPGKWHKSEGNQPDHSIAFWYAALGLSL
jgi:hypothetical protein